MPRAASPHGGNLVAAVRSLFKRSNKASSDAGPELASRESHEAMESPEALMCPLEKGVRGIETSGSGYLRYVEDAKAARSVFIRASSDAGRRTAKR